MRCEGVRTALSARLDGEDPQMSPAELDAHLATCPGCRTWLATAQQVTRAVRVRAVRVPDLTQPVLAALADARRDRRRAWRQILRAAVLLAAVAQIALTVPALLRSGIAHGQHAGREMASFDVALAVGFALAAYRPQRARGFVPVAVALAACLAVTSVIDVVNGTTTPVHEVGHLAAAVQAALLWALSRASPPAGVGRGRSPIAQMRAIRLFGAPRASP